MHNHEITTHTEMCPDLHPLDCAFFVKFRIVEFMLKEILEIGDNYCKKKGLCSCILLRGVNDTKSHCQRTVLVPFPSAILEPPDVSTGSL